MTETTASDPMPRPIAPLFMFLPPLTLACERNSHSKDEGRPFSGDPRQWAHRRLERCARARCRAAAREELRCRDWPIPNNCYESAQIRKLRQERRRNGRYPALHQDDLERRFRWRAGRMWRTEDAHIGNAREERPCLARERFVLIDRDDL